MKCQTLKRSAGRFSFDAGQTIDLSEDEAKELEAAGAVTILEAPKPQAPEPAAEEAEEPKAARKPSKKAAE